LRAEIHELLVRPPATGAPVVDLDDPPTRSAIDRLHDDVDAHASARLGWIDAWREAYPDWSAWALGIAGDDAGLRGLAALARRQRAGVLQIRCLGHTALDRAPIVSRSEPDARALARALAEELGALHRPWTMCLRQLRPGEAFAEELRSLLPVVDLVADAERPIVRLEGRRDPAALLSRNLRGAERRARNRIARDGLRCEIRWVRGADEILRRLPEIRAVHRARDLQLRHASLLDDPAEGALWDALFRRHLGPLELLEVRLSGELAAYLAWIRCGALRLVLDNRVAPRWTAYSAGLIANNVALCSAGADPGAEVLDWGSGVQRYKLQSATTVLAHERLYAWSSPRLRQVLAARRRVAFPRFARTARGLAFGRWAGSSTTPP
jgi:hypothetical protein